MTESLSLYGGSRLSDSQTSSRFKGFDGSFIKIETRRKAHPTPIRPIMKSQEFSAIARGLDSLYTADLDEVDERVDEFAWNSKWARNTWQEFILTSAVGYDLRGLSARVYTQGLYPRCPDISDPRSQTAYTLPIEGMNQLKELISKADTRLIPLGILEGLDRVSDFETARILFGESSDSRVSKRLEELLAEETDA